MKGQKQLFLQTLNFVAAFMVWVILSGLMPFIKQDIPMTSGQIAWVTAIPVILGSLLRIPLGYWANRFGARIVFSISFLLLTIPVFLVSSAQSFGMLIVGGFFLGIAGALFSVGVTSLPKYFAREKHGFINGIYGMGNVGTAVTTFFAPIVATHYGWQTAIRLYIVLLALFALVNVFLGDKAEPRMKASVVSQIKSVYRNEKVWIYSLFYFITFGSFVAFTVYLPNFLVANFHLTKVDAGLRTAGFIVLATLLRPVGGWLSDKWNAYKVLMFVFLGMSMAGIILSFQPSIQLYTVGCLMVAFFAGIGNGAVFKLVPTHFQKQAGVVNGIVAAAGGLGGFFPPLMLTTFYSITGNYAIGFMMLSEFALASFVVVIWMFFQDRLLESVKASDGPMNTREDSPEISLSEFIHSEPIRRSN